MLTPAWLLFALVIFPSWSLAGPSSLEENLEQRSAEQRREQVKSVGYSVHLSFRAGSTEYEGSTRIDLELAQLSIPLRIDWLGPPPLSLLVNGAEILDYKSRTGSLEIPARYLEPQTVLLFKFKNSFSSTGEGIQRIIDPEDKGEYIYTDLEPFQAHQIFPCLDQPDLKARFELRITAPHEWKIIGNELPEAALTEGEFTTTLFRTTPPLSTYLFFVGAGTFQEWKDQDANLPLHIYARKSIGKYVQAETVFSTVRKAIRFYSGYFGTQYPFSKVALVYVPEYEGGMENPGAITLGESTIFRGSVAQSRLDDRDELILHELAHMWFGDLVTMGWWNDLWLNESFATYMSSLAMDRALGSRTVWPNFASSKSWGYWQDQLVTSHPIETEVKDARSARGNFDGITYNKGAAAMQQLHFLVGEESFQKGLESFFRKHAFGVARRADFVKAIAETANLDLSKWTNTWLQTSGPNKVQVSWHCASNPQPVLTQLSLNQEKNSSGALAPHRTRVGLFRKEAGELRLLQALDVFYEQKTTEIKSAFGLPCPDFVFPNFDDKDYALFSLDEKSMKSAELALAGGMKDALVRLQLWEMLFQMVRDGKLSPLRYFEIALASLARESDEGVLSAVVSHGGALRGVYNEYLSTKDRESLAPRLEANVWRRVLSSPPASSLQLTFFDFYVRITQSPEGILRLRELLEKSVPPPGIQLDQDRRWAIVRSLARNGATQVPRLIEAELKHDPSNLGNRAAFVCRVALPDPEIKKKFWVALENPEKIQTSWLRAAAGEFHQPNQLRLSAAYENAFFNRIKKVNWKVSDHLVEVYFEGLFPRHLCSKKLLKHSQAKLKAARHLSPLAKRAWLEANDELSRCVKVGRR